MKSVAIIGAGIAGLSCANALDPKRFEVEVFDAARVPGGRVTTKKVGLVRFDAGAPFFTATSAEFAAEIATWEQRGFVARYAPRWSPDSVPPRAELWTGTPGMSAIPRELASELRLHWDAVVTRLHSDVDQLVLAVPVSSLRTLLGDAGPFEGVTVRRRWSVSLAWNERASAEWNAAAWQGRLLSLAVKESSKPDRAPGEHWMAYLSVEASAEFSNAADVVEAAREELGSLIGARGDVEARAHKWEEDVGETPPFVRVNERVVACGVSASVESAWLHGRHLAAAIPAQ